MSDVYLCSDLGKGHLSDCLLCYIKGMAKQASELVKVQSVLCEDAMCLKRLIVVRRSPLQRTDE